MPCCGCCGCCGCPHPPPGHLHPITRSCCPVEEGVSGVPRQEGAPAARAGWDAAPRSTPPSPHPGPAAETPQERHLQQLCPTARRTHHQAQHPSDTPLPLRVPPQARKEPEEPPSPIYLNIQELREEAAAAGPAPEEPGSSVSNWETHTDTGSGHLFYYNPVTGETTWDCPFGQGEDVVSPAASPTSSLAHSLELPEWDQYVDEGSGQAFFYNSVTGETSWDPPQAGDRGGSWDMHPRVTRYGATEQRVSTQRGAGMGGVRMRMAWGWGRRWRWR